MLENRAAFASVGPKGDKQRTIQTDDFAADATLERRDALRSVSKELGTPKGETKKQSALLSPTRMSLKKRGTVVVGRISELFSGLASGVKKDNRSSSAERKSRKPNADLEFDVSRELGNEIPAGSDVDSDSLVGNFTSEVWGEGTSKVIVAHYNTNQARRKKKFEES